MSSSQMDAADPRSSAFVTANAGSGKTTTLVDRVARLLLHEVEPQAILCVTYTKAAAAEMQTRLFEKLGDWAVAEDAKLYDQLVGLGEDPKTLRESISGARKLFAKALETPGGLKIQTLHAFCEALLRRFPLEAGVAPGFTVLDDAQAAGVSAKARDSLAEMTLAYPDHPLAAAYDHFAVELDLASFEGLLKTFEIDRRAIQTHIAECGGLNSAIAAAWRRCGFDAPTTLAALESEAVSACDWAMWGEKAKALMASNAKTDLTLGQGLARLARASGGGFEDIWKLFSTGKGEPLKSMGTQAIDPDIRAWLEGEQSRCHDAALRLRAARVAADTAYALTLGLAYIERYEGEKAAWGALDFSDLIVRTRELLTERSDAAWVLYKLDGGVDHVLLDEAQDTAPEQWEILQALTSEFFTGEGLPKNRPLERTVFVVGDKKQSIYSFQGARPEQLNDQGRLYEARTKHAGRRFTNVPLVESWRSTPELLSFVDAVFQPLEMRTALNAGADEPISHTPHRPFGGSVDLWPLEFDIKSDPPDAWDPVDLDPPESARKRLARKVAAEVARIISHEAVSEKTTEAARPAGPGDILILVRKRDAVFEEIIRALKQAKVPVAGADKLKLSDHIVFQDILALIRVCLFPSDDLRLAALLRSPLCTLDETSLYDLAVGREGRLWDTLVVRSKERAEWDAALTLLIWAQAEARIQTPFTFLGRLLSYLDQAGRSVRQRLLTRLGREAEDALDELLAEALKAEGQGLYDLERFAAALEASQIEVKREQQAGRDEVRVMTVHGAKGLEAPIVILPETAGAPPTPKGPLLRTKDGGFLFAPRKADDCEASAAARLFEAQRQTEEGLRLLYVALTRARDRVVVAGRLPGNRKMDKGADPASWYARLQTAFERPEIAEDVRQLGEVKRYGRDPRPARPKASALDAAANPGWLKRRPPPEPAFARYAAPSQLTDILRGPCVSPLSTTGGLGRFRRGELIHKLLEVLPGLPPAARPAGAETLLAKSQDLTPDQRAEMTSAAFAVLEDERFAEVFGPGSVAEAAIAGGAPDLPPLLRISGRLDRVVITPQRVLVVDFKTNRPAPRVIEEADPAYIIQMAVYVAVLRSLYPGRRVEAALVWTDGPKLMLIPEILIDQTLAELRAGR